jgi:hypothetical protein
MTAIFCDSCKKEVPGARKDINYVTVLDKDLCLSCEERLRQSLRQQTAARRPVIFKEYQDTLSRTLQKLCGAR